MMRVVRGLLIALLAAASLPAPANAQNTAGAVYSQDELDQLLAPIALYPDQLLTQVLIAATYPLEVVEAARFVQRHPELIGETLDQAITDSNWDPSVQSLAAFPQVLAMMDDQLEWTQRLGDAFLSDQQRVMDTVQSLRQRAEAAGTLRSTPQQTVLDQDGAIIVEPQQPDVIYVPVYDPLYVYGPWWAPAYPPWFWYPPAYYGYPAVIIGIVFGSPCSISHHHWDWAHPDWHHHEIAIDGSNNRFWNRPGRPPPVGSWQHSPGHRKGVAYPDAATRSQFAPLNPEAVRMRQQFRGYESRPATSAQPGAVQPPQGVVQPTPRITRSAPPPRFPEAIPQQRVGPFDPGVSRQQAQANAQRGMQSRQSMIPSAPAAGAGSEAHAPPGGGHGR